MTGTPESCRLKWIRKTNKSDKAMDVGHRGSSGTNCWIEFEADVIGILLTQTRGKDSKPFRVELENSINTCIAK